MHESVKVTILCTVIVTILARLNHQKTAAAISQGSQMANLLSVSRQTGTYARTNRLMPQQIKPRHSSLAAMEIK